MRITIHFSESTVKGLHEQLAKAFAGKEIRLIRRIEALLLLGDALEPDQIADRLGVSRAAIYHWLSSFLRNGLASLVYHSPKGRSSKLTTKQKEELVTLIEAGPRSCGYSTGCWSGKLIAEVIQKRFGVKYNFHYVCTLLSQMGFSYQKARFISDHLDAEVRERWLNQEWPLIVDQARKTGALLLFGDEVSFAQWGSLSYTWARRGEQPLVKTSGKRKGYKVFGLCDYFTGRLFYRGQEERLTSESYCTFLKEVLRQTETKLIVVQDGAKYHTSKETSAFIKAHEDRLKVYRLPTYSPDYNPIEHLWRNVKKETTHNNYFETFAELKTEVEKALLSFQQNQAVVKQALGIFLDHVLRQDYAA